MEQTDQVQSVCFQYSICHTHNNQTLILDKNILAGYGLRQLYLMHTKQHALPVWSTQNSSGRLLHSASGEKVKNETLLFKESFIIKIK